MMLKTIEGVMYLISKNDTHVNCYDDQTGKNYSFLNSEIIELNKLKINTMTQIQKDKLIKFLDSAKFEKLVKEAEKADNAPMAKASNKSVSDLCIKYALIEPKVKMISMLFAMVFPKSKLDFTSLIDGLTAFCSVQK